MLKKEGGVRMRRSNKSRAPEEIAQHYPIIAQNGKKFAFMYDLFPPEDRILTMLDPIDLDFHSDVRFESTAHMESATFWEFESLWSPELWDLLPSPHFIAEVSFIIHLFH